MPIISAAASESSTPQASQSPSWTQKQFLLVDTGAYTHVCSPDFAPHCPVFQKSEHVAEGTAFGAGDSQLNLLGFKRVPGYMVAMSERNVHLEIEFTVYKVRRTILAGNKLKQKNVFIETDNPHSRLIFKKRRNRAGPLPDETVRIVDWGDLPWVEFFFEVEGSRSIDLSTLALSAPEVPSQTMHEDRSTPDAADADMAVDRDEERSMYSSWCMMCVKPTDVDRRLLSSAE